MFFLDREIAELLEQSCPIIELAQRHDLLLSGGWDIGADMLGWIFPILKADVGQAHRAEAKFGYIVTAGSRSQKNAVVLVDER